MKNLKLLLLVVFLSPTLLNASVHYTECKLASAHLIDVNQEWKNHLSTQYDYLISFNSEDDRIQFHLKMVIELLKKESIHLVDSPSKSKREDLINHLSKYSLTKVFPKNKFHDHQRPYFVDHLNTHCAVGHLLKCDNENELIQKIKTKQNYAYIKEMQFPELDLWAVQNGFSKNELALIQPGYPSSEFVWDRWGDGNGIEGTVNVMKTLPNESLLILGGQFTAIDGVVANSIIAYNGTDWITLGDGVNGSVNDIAIAENSDVYIGGDFMIDGVKVNVALWAGTEWVPMSDNADGTIHTLQLHQDKLFVGGSFTQIEGITCSNLAYYDFSSMSWSTDSDDGTEGVFSVDGIVRDIEVNSFDSLIIGGSFNLTGTLSTVMDINTDSCYNLSFWNGNDWEHKYSDPIIPEVHVLSTEDYSLLIGGDMSKDVHLVYYNDSEGWTDMNSTEEPYYTYDEGPIIQGFITMKGALYGYGSIIPNFSGGGTVSNYLVSIPPFGGNVGINSIDGSIRSAIKFQEQYYFTGDFSKIEGIEMNGLARTDGTLPVLTIPELDLTIKSTFNQLFITGELQEKASIGIVNNSGQMIKSMQINAGHTNVQIPLDDLPNGMYYYRFESNGILQSDKIIVLNGL